MAQPDYGAPVRFARLGGYHSFALSGYEMVGITEAEGEAESMGRVSVEEINLPVAGLPADADGIRIAHLSDLRLRRWNPVLQAIQAELLATNIDLLLVTGDFSERSSDYRDCAALVRRLFGPVRAPLGAFGVLGSGDDARFPDEDLPLTLLHDSVRLLGIGRGEVYLAGVEQNTSRYGAVLPLVEMIGNAGSVLVMNSDPSSAHELPNGAGITMFSGRWRRRNSRFSMLGNLFDAGGWTSPMPAGLHAINGNWVHAHAGSCGPISLARLWRPAEITILTLRCSQPISRRAKQRQACMV